MLQLVIDDKTLLVPAGCSAVARTDLPHRYANDSLDELIFTMTVAELHG